MRQHYGLSQAELAALLGSTPALVSMLEAGRRAPGPAVAGRLAPFEAAQPPADATAQLARATANVAHYTAEAARPGLSEAELRTAKRALIAARGRRDNLELSAETTSGPLAYLADMDADQVDAQLATLTAAMQAVSARRAALPA